MKTIVALSFAVALWPVASFAGETHFKVQGMTCASCEETISTALKKVKGVTETEVNHERGLAWVKYTDSVDAKSLTNAIATAGYRAEVIDQPTASTLAMKEQPSSCSLDAHKQATARGNDVLSDGDLEKVVTWAAKYIRENRKLPNPQDAKPATGVSVPMFEVVRIRAALTARLADDKELAALASPSRCDDYGACGLHEDLATASGETLKMYVREKGEDGRRYTHFKLPGFTARTFDGKPVSSADFKGKATIVAMLGHHCIHSIQSLPVLEEAFKNNDRNKLNVLAVFLNSGEVTTPDSWTLPFKPTYPVWAAPDLAMADALQTHLVPSYFYVDAAGNVKGKLVGFKSQAELGQWISEWATPQG